MENERRCKISDGLTIVILTAQWVQCKCCITIGIESDNISIVHILFDLTFKRKISKVP